MMIIVSYIYYRENKKYKVVNNIIIYNNNR
jgi:hypothetical protein